MSYIVTKKDQTNLILERYLKTALENNQVFCGVVTNVVEFGVFINLEGKIDGLLHRSKTKKVPQLRQKILIVISEIKFNEKKKKTEYSLDIPTAEMYRLDIEKKYNANKWELIPKEIKESIIEQYRSMVQNDILAIKDIPKELRISILKDFPEELKKAKYYMYLAKFYETVDRITADNYYTKAIDMAQSGEKAICYAARARYYAKEGNRKACEDYDYAIKFAYNNSEREGYKKERAKIKIQIDQIEDLIERGKYCYYQKRYYKAMEYFGEAAKISKNNLLIKEWLAKSEMAFDAARTGDIGDGGRAIGIYDRFVEVAGGAAGSNKR